MAMGIETYQQTQERTETPRAAEYRALTQLTAALRHAEKQPDDIKAWVAAIIANQQFWSRLRLHVLHANTCLPDEMRLQFISLSQWVERESAKLVSGEGDLVSLIAVNQQIMEGLKPFTGSIAENTLQAAV